VRALEEGGVLRDRLAAHEPELRRVREAAERAPDGRLGLLVALAVMPALLERFEGAFSVAPPMDDRGRFLTGLGVTIAVGVAFEPGIALAIALVLMVQILGGARRGRGTAWSLGGILAACVLLFPFVPTIVAGGGAAFGSSVGSRDPWDLLRLSPGVAPGSWVVAWFLPVAAVAGLALASGERRGPALRAAAASPSTPTNTAESANGRVSTARRSRG